MQPNDPHDDSPPGLGNMPTLRLAPGLREATLALTTRLVHRLWWLHLAKIGMACLACYLGGAATVWLLGGNRGNRIEPAPITLPKKIDEPQPISPGAVPLEQDDDVPVTILERLASAASPEKRGLLYRRAGDRYLQEQNDLQSAIRCYRHALDKALPDERNVNSEDSWLLIALKNARKENVNHVDRGS